MNYEPLNDALHGATKDYNVYPTSFKDVAEGYKEKFGQHGWIGELAKRISGSEGKRGPEYLAARRSIERVASGQYKSVGKAEYKAGLVEAGKTLDPLQKDAPPTGLTITVAFHAPEDKGHRKRDREMTVHLDHATAVQYINQAQPDYSFLFDEWFDDGGDAYGEDGDYEADILYVSAA